jgi:alkanesulfonate monooxygenase SsuD/methylene tetrahydromethanopterin reductase-like flavin-dependent oxidoreductase (luciferase family)
VDRRRRREGHAAHRGTDRIVRSTNLSTVIAETDSEVRDRLAAIEARWVPPLGADRASAYRHELEKSPGVGTVEQVAERLAALRDVGLGYAIHYFPEAAHDRSGIELFEREVIPALA